MDDVCSIILGARFTTVRLRAGYDQDAVDTFLDTLAAAAAEEQDLAPLIQDARFPTTSLREGYDIAEVDAFLSSLVRPVAATPGAAAREPDVSVAPVPRSADDGVVQEVPGLFRRLFGRR